LWPQHSYDGTSTHVIDWRPNEIVFSAYEADSDVAYYTWSTTKKVPTADDLMKPMINFWMF